MAIINEMALDCSRKRLYYIVRNISKAFSNNDVLDNVLKESGEISSAKIILVADRKVTAHNLGFFHKNCPLFPLEVATIQSPFLDGNFIETTECLFTSQKCFWNIHKRVYTQPLHEGTHGISHLVLVSNLELPEEELMILTEITAVFFNQFLRFRAPGSKEMENKNKELQKILRSLRSFSFTQECVFKAIIASIGTGNEKQVIKLQNIAKSCSVSASTVQKTIKLLQCAGVLECFSLGSKGTLIKVKKHFLWEIADQLQNKTSL